MTKNRPKRKDGTIPKSNITKSSSSNNANTTNTDPIRIKILTLGSIKVGKSCFVKKYCEKNRFASNYIPTIGVDYGVKSVTRNVENGSSEVDIKIDFYDLSGDPNYRDVRNEFYGDLDGVILMFDLTEKSTFEALPSWLSEMREFGATSVNCTVVVVGNKIDQYPRVVTEQQGTVFAAENNAAYFETSAKTGASVDDVFDFMMREACKKGHYK